MGTVERRLWLLDSGLRVVAVRGVDPVWTMTAGPLLAEDIRRVVLEDEDDVHVRVMLGGLADLLRRMSAAELSGLRAARTVRPTSSSG